jgi:hypothetical protein
MAVLDWLQQMLGGGQAGEDTAASGRLADTQPGANAFGQGVLGAGQAIGGDIGDMLNALWGTAKIPGQVYAGERQPSVDDALSVALTTIGGGFRPAGSLGATYSAFKGMYPYDWRKTPVTDGRGNVVRAGTYEPVTQFQSTTGPYAGFFSDSPDVASRFARAFQGAVYPTKITMDNPAIIDAGGKPAGAFQFADMAREHGTLDDMKLFHRATRDPRSNYDGVILKNTKDEGTVYVPRKSQQVRSIFEDNGGAGLLGAAEQQ